VRRKGEAFKTIKQVEWEVGERRRFQEDKTIKWNVRRKGEGFKKIKQVECQEKRRRFPDDKTSGM